MMQETDYAKDLTQIRSLMERSSRFISLSGLSGVSARQSAARGTARCFQCMDRQALRDQRHRVQQFPELPLRAQAAA